MSVLFKKLLKLISEKDFEKVNDILDLYNEFIEKYEHIATHGTEKEKVSIRAEMDLLKKTIKNTMDNIDNGVLRNNSINKNLEENIEKLEKYIPKEELDKLLNIKNTPSKKTTSSIRKKRIKKKRRKLTG